MNAINSDQNPTILPSVIMRSLTDSLRDRDETMRVWGKKNRKGLIADRHKVKRTVSGLGWWHAPILAPGCSGRRVDLY